MSEKFIFNYFPNTRQMAGYFTTLRSCYSIKLDSVSDSAFRPVAQSCPTLCDPRQCPVRNINAISCSLL